MHIKQKGPALPAPRHAQDIEAQRQQIKQRHARPVRRPEEDHAAWDYLERMRILGPREGESYLAFYKRLATIEAARHLWLDLWVAYKGQQTQLLQFLGIPRNNMNYELRQVGLTPKMLYTVFNPLSTLADEEKPVNTIVDHILTEGPKIHETMRLSVNAKDIIHLDPGKNVSITAGVLPKKRTRRKRANKRLV